MTPGWNTAYSIPAIQKKEGFNGVVALTVVGYLGAVYMEGGRS